MRTFLTYFALSAFLFIFSRIYESFSYGEVSFYMHYMFCVTLIGGAIVLGMMALKKNLSRISFNLWNSGVAVITAGFLLRGIINLSGRSTTLDKPCWYIGCAILLIALVSIPITAATSKKRQKQSQNKQNRMLLERNS